jgi:hypothetical protein
LKHGANNSRRSGSLRAWRIEGNDLADLEKHWPTALLPKELAQLQEYGALAIRRGRSA